MVAEIAFLPVDSHRCSPGEIPISRLGFVPGNAYPHSVCHHNRIADGCNGSEIVSPWRHAELGESLCGYWCRHDTQNSLISCSICDQLHKTWIHLRVVPWCAAEPLCPMMQTRRRLGEMWEPWECFSLPWSLPSALRECLFRYLFLQAHDR